MKFKYTVTAFYSKPDKFGNCYWAFHFIDHETGLQIAATTTGGESNIYAIRRHWDKDEWDPSFIFTTKEMSIREFNRMTKGWSHAGCDPQEMVAFIRKNLGLPPSKIV